MRSRLTIRTRRSHMSGRTSPGHHRHPASPRPLEVSATQFQGPVSWRLRPRTGRTQGRSRRMRCGRELSGGPRALPPSVDGSSSARHEWTLNSRNPSRSGAVSRPAAAPPAIRNSPDEHSPAHSAHVAPVAAAVRFPSRTAAAHDRRRRKLMPTAETVDRPTVSRATTARGIETALTAAGRGRKTNGRQARGNEQQTFPPVMQRMHRGVGHRGDGERCHGTAATY